jgi:hypothetical protein
MKFGEEYDAKKRSGDLRVNYRFGFSGNSAERPGV